MWIYKLFHTEHIKQPEISYPGVGVPAYNDAVITSRFMQEHLTNPVLHFGRSFVSRFGTVTKIANLTAVFHDLHGNTLALVVGQVEPKLFQLVQPSLRNEPFLTEFLQSCYKSGIVKPMSNVALSDVNQNGANGERNGEVENVKLLTSQGPRPYSYVATNNIESTSVALQIQNYYHYSFLQKLIIFTVNEHENISIAELNRRAGYVTDRSYEWMGGFLCELCRHYLMAI